MGIVLAIEAIVGIVEAVEAVATVAETGEAIAGAAEAGEAIASGAEAGAEAGTEAGAEAGAEAGGEAGGEAGAEAGGEALQKLLSKLAEYGQKLAKMVIDYVKVDAAFKAAKYVLEQLKKDPKAHERAIKLTKLINVLNTTGTLLQNLSDWITNNASKEVKVKDYVVSLQGILSKFIPHIGSSAAVLKKLASQVSQKNVKKDPVTDGELSALEKGLTTVLQSFKQLADFKNEHSEKIIVLKEMPITSSQVASLQAQMPAL